MYIFEVRLAHEDISWIAYYTASHMQKVIDELKTDLNDEATTVLSIREIGKILKSL